MQVPRHETEAKSTADVLAERRAAKARHGTRLFLDEGTERIVAEIVNANNEVIKQIPPEEALRIAAKFREVIGLLVDQRI